MTFGTQPVPAHIVLVSSVAGHSLAAAGFYETIGVADIGAAVGFYLPLALSLSASIAAYIVRARRPFVAALTAHALFAMLSMYAIAETGVLSLCLLLPLLASVGIYEPFPRNLALSAAIVLPATFVRSRILSAGPDTLNTVVNTTGFLFVSAFIAAGSCFYTHLREELIRTRRDNSRLDAAVSKLTTANLSYQQYAQTAEERSVVEERRRISRDIHDIVGYTLTNNIILMEAATDMMRRDPVGVPALINNARENAENGLQQVREALGNLRRQDDGRPEGLRALVKLISVYEVATGVKVQFEFGDTPWTFGREIDSIVYHLVQEALVNAFRHGKATNIRVHVVLADTELQITVRDNGTGTGSFNDGIGIAGMRERLEKIGGTMKAGNVTDGFALHAVLPLGTST